MTRKTLIPIGIKATIIAHVLVLPPIINKVATDIVVPIARIIASGFNLNIPNLKVPLVHAPMMGK